MRLFENTGYKRIGLIFFLVLVISLNLAALFVTPRPAGAQATAIPDTKVMPYGVNTFLDKEVEFWKKEKTMQMINQAGIQWIKQLFAWNEIEFRKGYFTDDKNKKPGWQKFDEIVDLAAKYNIKVVARIDQTPAWANPAGGSPGGRPANFQDYADFLKEFVKHYKGKVQYIQVWNEPNLEREWIPGQKVNPAQYVEMLKIAYKAIKETDPAVKVMAAPLAITLEEQINLSELAFLDQMYKAGAKDFFDIMPANAYGLEFPPEAAPDPKVLNFRRVELLRQVMVKNGDENKAVWFNEYGWNASPPSIPAERLTWRRVTEQQQAEYTSKGIKYARQNWPWSGVVFIWFFRQVGDIPDDRSEQYFQLVTKDFTPKPVYNVIKQDALQFLQQQNIPTPAPVNTPVPATSTPIPGATTAAASPSPGAINNTPVAGRSPNAAGATTVAGTVVASAPRPAATPTPAGRSGLTPVATPQDDGGSLLFVIIGAALVLGAGGGLALWFAQQRRVG